MNDKEQKINLQWNIHPVIRQQTIRCTTPIEAIAKIGGLLFVLRVSFIVRFLHELMFDMKMRKRYPASMFVKNEDSRKRSTIHIEPTLPSKKQYALNDTLVESNTLSMIKGEDGE